MRKPDNSPFCGRIQKIQLTSGSISYGPRPEPDEEVEQRITITRNGSVWLTRWAYGAGIRYKLISREQFKAEAQAVTQLLERLEAYFIQDLMIAMATDVDVWNLKLTNTSNEVFRYHGSVSIGLVPELDEISDQLRRAVGRHGLIAFNGAHEKLQYIYS